MLCGQGAGLRRRRKEMLVDIGASRGQANHRGLGLKLEKSIKDFGKAKRVT